jgi:hypothetical protein
MHDHPDAEDRILADLARTATSLDAVQESLVIAQSHILRDPPTVRELLAEVHGAATLGVFLLNHNDDPLLYPAHPRAVEQDCYDETVAALGFDPLDDEAVAA